MTSFLVSIPEQQLSVWGSTAVQALGTRGQTQDGAVYQYVENTGAAIAVYSAVKIADTYLVSVSNDTNCPASKVHKIGVAQVAIPIGSTTPQFGWVFVGPGNFTALIAASCVQDVQLLTTNTDGVLDDAGTSNVMRCKLITTIVGAAASACFATGELGTIN